MYTPKQVWLFFFFFFFFAYIVFMKDIDESVETKTF